MQVNTFMPVLMKARRGEESSSLFCVGLFRFRKQMNGRPERMERNVQKGKQDQWQREREIE